MATTVSAVSVKVEGLTDEQCRALSGVKLGDVILFEKLYDPPINGDDESQASHDADLEDAQASDQEEDEEEDEEEDGEEDGEEDLGASSMQGSVSAEESSSQEESDEEGTEPTLDSEEEVVEVVSTDRLYLVTGTSHDETGAALEDISLVELSYDLLHADEHTFQLFGTEISHIASKDCTHALDSECQSRKSFKQLAQNDGLQSHTIRLNPSGDYVRPIVQPNSLCPANCDEGWLESRESLADHVSADVYTSPATHPHQPVCPVCLGLDLLKDHQALRATFEATYQVDFGALVEFIGRLNVRRAQVGHGFYQLDERQWGMLFDDMGQSDDEDGDVDANGGVWEQWAEAMDPSANVQLRPASEKTIAALPRMAYQDVPVKGEEEKAAVCVVCTTSYEAEHVVVVLPCGHFSCDGECTTAWLSKFDSCPCCRARVCAVEETNAIDKDDGLAEEGHDAVANEENDENADEDDDGFANEEHDELIDIGTLAALRWADEGAMADAWGAEGAGTVSEEEIDEEKEGDEDLVMSDA